MSSIFTTATDFLKNICAFMLLQQLASLSDDRSMLQKSSCFCLKKLNHLGILIKSYTDAVTSVNSIFQVFQTQQKLQFIVFGVS